MTPDWAKMIAGSRDAALLLSMCFNMVCCVAIGLMWRRYVNLEKRVTDLLAELVREMSRHLGGHS